VELGIPYRWEDGLVLVVPAGVEEQVDALLDEIDENALDDSDEEALDDLETGEDGGDGRVGGHGPPRSGDDGRVRGQSAPGRRPSPERVRRRSAVVVPVAARLWS
jgi:hypothetical protein